MTAPQCEGKPHVSSRVRAVVTSNVGSTKYLSDLADEQYVVFHKLHAPGQPQPPLRQPQAAQPLPPPPPPLSRSPAPASRAAQRKISARRHKVAVQHVVGARAVGRHPRAMHHLPPSLPPSRDGALVGSLPG
jgi:hypothetical protein